MIVYSADGLTQSGRTISTTYDGAGRAAGLQGLRNGTATNYAGTPVTPFSQDI